MHTVKDHFEDRFCRTQSRHTGTSLAYELWKCTTQDIMDRVLKTRGDNPALLTAMNSVLEVDQTFLYHTYAALLCHTVDDGVNGRGV